MEGSCKGCPTNRTMLLNPGSDGSTAKISGEVQKSARVRELIHQKPLVGALALDDWGQAPWRVTSIMAQASLMFERESGDKNKQQLAQEAKCRICNHIATMKGHYEEILLLNGEASDPAKKIAKDISYCETILDLIESQVNGLVSRQRKWRSDTAALDKCYEAKIAKSGLWDTIKKHMPWGVLPGAGAGVALWVLNGWAAVIALIQFGVAQLTQAGSEIQKLIDDAVKLFVNMGGAALLMVISNALDQGVFKRREKLKAECKQKEDDMFEEEKTYRLQLFATIKEKALELCVKYGYLQELEMEDKAYANLLKASNFDEVNKIHHDRIKEIYGGSVPEQLWEGADLAHSNNNIDVGLTNGGQPS